MFGQLLVAGIRYLLDGAGSRVRYRIFDYFLIQRDRPGPTLDMGSDARLCQKHTRNRLHRTCTGVKESMRMLFDILKKDRKGTFQWLETVSDIETAKARVLQLSSESPDEFIVFRETDLQVVATSRQFPERLQSFAD
jgi:hypothetical protein